MCANGVQPNWFCTESALAPCSSAIPPCNEWGVPSVEWLNTRGSGIGAFSAATIGYHKLNGTLHGLPCNMRYSRIARVTRPLPDSKAECPTVGQEACRQRKFGFKTSGQDAAQER